jgi:hypothetical protein
MNRSLTSILIVIVLAVAETLCALPRGGYYLSIP